MEVSKPTEDARLLAKVRRLTRNGQAKAIRKNSDLSQGEIARLVGVSPAAVSRWEAGVRAPQGEAALVYARVLEELQA
jgi:DNA-binding transcriptional regulator YiaG